MNQLLTVSSGSPVLPARVCLSACAGYGQSLCLSYHSLRTATLSVVRFFFPLRPLLLRLTPSPLSSPSLPSSAVGLGLGASAAAAKHAGRQSCIV